MTGGVAPLDSFSAAAVPLSPPPSSSGGGSSSSDVGAATNAAAAAVTNATVPNSPSAKPKKITIYVTAGCGRCGHRVAQWSVRQKTTSTPAPPVDPSEVPGDAAAVAAAHPPPSATITGASTEGDDVTNVSHPLACPPPLGVPAPKAPPYPSVVGTGTGTVSGTAPLPVPLAAGALAHEPPATPTAAAAPPSVVGAPEASSVDHYPEHVNEAALFPSHIKCTFLGPEHVLLFPDVAAANYFLTGAVPLKTEGVNGTASDDPAVDKIKPKDGGLTVSGGLVCPRCDFLLASSPTKKTLGLKGRVCVYKPLLTLVSATEKPPDGTVPLPATVKDMPKIVPTHHAALPVVRTRNEFWECLLKSALAPAMAANVPSATPASPRAGGLIGGGKDGAKTGAAGEPPAVPPGANIDAKDDPSSPSYVSLEKMGERYSTSHPAALVIVMVGQFWDPFSVSAIVRLSDYKRRQWLARLGVGVDQQDGGSAGGAKGRGGGHGTHHHHHGHHHHHHGSKGNRGHGPAKTRTPYKGGSSTPSKPGASSAAAVASKFAIATGPNLAMPPNAAGGGTTSTSSPSAGVGAAADIPKIGTPAPALAAVGYSRSSAASPVIPGGKNSLQRSSSSNGNRRPISVTTPGGAGVGAASAPGRGGPPGGGPSGKGGGPQNSGAKPASSPSSSTPVPSSPPGTTYATYVPSTFLLMDSFTGAGGVSPSDVLLPDRAADVASLPSLSFLVWYRGCRVLVEGTSQHFRCVRGAVVGLDLARYVDIVVPRIAHEARVAFAQATRGYRNGSGKKKKKKKGGKEKDEGGDGKSKEGDESKHGDDDVDSEDDGSDDDSRSGASEEEDADDDTTASAGTGKSAANNTSGGDKAEKASSSKKVGKGHNGKSGLRIWTTEAQVPPYAERPVLHIKL